MKTINLKWDSIPYFYTYEKLSSAINCLATHPGDIRARLASAFYAF